jgi:hypothetical protein
MKNSLGLLLLVVVVGLGLVACKSTRLNSTGSTNKAERLRSDGAARDMAEAQRMADDHYWIENARTKEDAERQKRQETAAKK